MDEKDKMSFKIKQIGLGIIGFACILFVFSTFMLAFFSPSDLYSIIFIQILVCIGLFFLFLGSSHDEIGNYLIFMGLGLIAFGIVFMVLLNISFISLLFNIGYFFLFGFPFGYLSGPICILLGIYKKKKKDRYQTGIVSIVGLVIFSVSFNSTFIFF